MHVHVHIIIMIYTLKIDYSQVHIMVAAVDVIIIYVWKHQCNRCVYVQSVTMGTTPITSDMDSASGDW